jgi:hypothetical protein
MKTFAILNKVEMRHINSTPTYNVRQEYTPI